MVLRVQQVVSGLPVYLHVGNVDCVEARVLGKFDVGFSDNSKESVPNLSVFVSVILVAPVSSVFAHMSLSTSRFLSCLCRCMYPSSCLCPFVSFCVYVFVTTSICVCSCLNL